MVRCSARHLFAASLGARRRSVVGTRYVSATKEPPRSKFANESIFGRFFFQADDGIRDGRVTGVQTCALPICCGAPWGTAVAWWWCHRHAPVRRRTFTDRESVVEGKRVDLGGRRVI